MLELCRAEWIKIVGHRRPLTYLLGIFPLGAMLVFCFAGLIAAIDPTSKHNIEMYMSNWHDLVLGAWAIPSHPIGRVFLMGFTAFTFAGEYQWGTWKNITPRRRRSVLMLVKFGVLSALVLIAFTLTSLIMALGGTVVSAMVDVEMNPAFDFQQIRLLLPDYLLAAGTAFLAFLITATFAAFVSIFSRSILGGSMAGILLIFAEASFLLVPLGLSRLLEMPGLIHLQRGVPLYNLENIRSWMQSGEATQMLDWSFSKVGLAVPVDGAVFSAVLIAGWVLLGITAIMVLFERQDITT